MEIGYEDNLAGQTLEGLEKRFYDEVMKLAKEQNDAEDAENARHREKVNAINTQYDEQLTALRVGYAKRRDEFLRRESHARQQQYQQAAMELQYANTGMGFMDPHGYSAQDSQRTYNASAQFDSYRDRPRFPGGNRDPGFDPRAQYPGGRAYGSGSGSGSGSRYYQ